MRYLITGATGFIGSKLFNKLLDNKNKVIVLSASDSLNIDNKSNVSILKYKRHYYDKIPELLNSIGKVDVVFHLAANMSYLKYSQDSIIDNVYFTKQLVKWAVNNSAKKFIYTSSIDAMGPNLRGAFPLDETSVCKPLSCYGKSKLMAERFINLFDLKQTKCMIIRLGNVYGPGSLFVVNDLLKSALNKNTELYKFSNTIKDFKLQMIYVDDVANILYKLACKEWTFSKEIIIMANMESVSIKELTTCIKELASSNNKSPVIKSFFYNKFSLYLRKIYFLYWLKKADLLTYITLGDWSASSEKANRLFGVSTETSLEIGLKETVNYAMRNNLTQ